MKQELTGVKSFISSFSLADGKQRYAWAHPCQPSDSRRLDSGREKSLAHCPRGKNRRERYVVFPCDWGSFLDHDTGFPIPFPHILPFFLLKFTRQRRNANLLGAGRF